MKILILTASLPYLPASGGALRAYGIIKGLHESRHEVTLFSFHHTDVIPEDHPLRAVTHEIITVTAPSARSKWTRFKDLIFSRQPDIARRLYSEAFASALQTLLKRKQFDLVQVEGIEVACYLPSARETQPDAKLCFDTFNAEYLLQQNIYEIDRQSLKRLPVALYSYIQTRRIKRFEYKMCQLVDLVFAVSDEDAAALRDFRHDRTIYVIPSGIYADIYHNQNTRRDNWLLVFTGKMDYRPNVDAMLWFYEAIFPHITKQLPDVKLAIVGQQTHPRLDIMKNDPRVTLTGWVDSVQSYLDQAGVYIAPLRMGSGTRLKLLEAMASQCAIVATSMAASGLTERVRETMKIVDDETAFAQTVIELLQDETTRLTMGEQARIQVKAHYDWAVLIPHILKAYKDIGLG